MCISQMTRLKTSVVSLERSNIDTTKENKDLRQFSLDGFETALVVKQLSKDRDEQKSKLDDLDETLRHLLDKNDSIKE